MLVASLALGRLGALLRPAQLTVLWFAGSGRRSERAPAAAQCERADLPIISGPDPCAEMIARVPSSALRVVFGARAEGALTITQTPEQVWCAIGPEGGFSEAELAAFRAGGFVVVSLGRSILRVDTAVASALTVVQDRLVSLQAR